MLKDVVVIHVHVNTHEVTCKVIADVASEWLVKVVGNRNVKKSPLFFNDYNIHILNPNDGRFVLLLFQC